jgi:voltage-gated potassium channel
LLLFRLLKGQGFENPGGTQMRRNIKIILAVALVAIAYSIIFMVLMGYEGQTQNVNLITALYWVIITITTLGYGDIVFHSQIGRIFSIIVSLSGIFILWAVVLPLVITPRLENVVKPVPISAPKKIEGHVIISGYSPMVEALTDRLSLLKIPFLIIERSEETARSIYQRYPTTWGDPSLVRVLMNAGIGSSRLLIANEREEQNAEVILTARAVSDVELIAIVDDLTQSRFQKYAGASRTISPKTILGTFLAQITLPPRKNIFPGAIHLFGDLMIVELPIYPGSRLIEKNPTIESIKSTGGCIAGIWQKGVFLPNPGPGEIIRSNSVLVAVGSPEQLSMIRDMTLGARREGPLIILGYGDVGRRVASVLCESDMRPVIVDRRELGDIPFEHIKGDATSEETLIVAGIKEAVGTMILLNEDSDAIYATLLAKDLNPGAFVVARANQARSVEKIYRAGADYVASMPIVASHMLAKIIEGEQEELALLYENLELKFTEVNKRSSLAGKTLSEIDLPGRFGCRAVVINKAGRIIACPDEDTTVEPGDTIAMIGSPKGVEAFSCAHDHVPALQRLLGMRCRFAGSR